MNTLIGSEGILQHVRSYLWSEVSSRPNVLVLGPGCPPRVVQLEALIAVARLAVHAALGGLLHSRRLAQVAHDGDSGTGRLPVALHNALQREVSEEHADAPLAQLYVTLATWAWEAGDTGGDRGAPPAGGG